MIKPNSQVLFIGGLFPEEEYQTIFEQTKHSMQNAANNLQWEIISGLEQNLGKSVSIISAYFIGTYPNAYDQASIKEQFYTHSEQQIRPDHYVGFENRRGKSKLSKYKALKKAVDRYFEENQETPIYVVGYSWSIVISKLLAYIKSKYSNALVVAFVPDLPQYMNLTQNPVYRFLKMIEIQMLNQDAKCMDGFVYITESMASFFPAEKPYMVIEGIAPENPFEPKTNRRNIVYTGGISKDYGIVDLVSAFKRLKGDDLLLEIYGDGDAISYLKEATQQDSRIRYNGSVAREDILKVQAEAFVLVNPRPEAGEFTKFSFPSKTLEYMVSGTPFIGYRLAGIPKEYFTYMSVASDSEEGLYRELETILSKPAEEIRALGLNAKEFAMSQKTAKKQTQKILDLFSELEKNRDGVS